MSFLRRLLFRSSALKQSDQDTPVVDWDIVDGDIRIYVSVHHLAIDKRHMTLRPVIDIENHVVTVFYSIVCSGRVYRHQSVVRGFGTLTLDSLQGMDPNTCDWLAQKE
ncbi:MAG: hypothetical protein HRU15_13780 [Planctomycetes bacterium]|nr:hypothetical protein [Planctomycetota bacterium]